MNILEDFKDINVDDIKQSTDFTQALIDYALKGKHSPIEFIKNFGERSIVRTLVSANTKLTVGFTRAAEASYKDYIKKQKEGIDDIRLLLAHRTFKKCAQFYQEEVDAAYDRLQEYTCYLFSGHIIDNLLLGYDRDYSDMVDFRTKGDE